MSEEDVLKLKLPEHLDYNLDILFVSVLKLNTYSGHVIYCSATNEDTEEFQFLNSNFCFPLRFKKSGFHYNHKFYETQLQVCDA